MLKTPCVGDFHTTRARHARWYPRGALDIYIPPPPLEAWGGAAQNKRGATSMQVRVGEGGGFSVGVVAHLQLEQMK